MKPGDYGWLTVIFVVSAYEVAALRRRDDWELLSEAAERYRSHAPWPVGVVVVYMAGHLLRVWPRRIDPLGWLTRR